VQASTAHQWPQVSCHQPRVATLPGQRIGRLVPGSYTQRKQAPGWDEKAFP
jgi:hypothetical protein